jgi:murein DD-endopeptidase MepM/ murein hydrolase activator NlpD
LKEDADKVIGVVYGANGEVNKSIPFAIAVANNVDNEVANQKVENGQIVSIDSISLEAPAGMHFDPSDCGYDSTFLNGKVVFLSRLKDGVMNQFPLKTEKTCHLIVDEPLINPNAVEQRTIKASAQYSYKIEQTKNVEVISRPGYFEGTPLVFPLKSIDVQIKNNYGQCEIGGYEFGVCQNKIDGVDIVALKGTEVLAVADGTVNVADPDGWDEKPRLGNVVRIEHKNPESGQNFYSLYAFLDTVSVTSGNQVSKGQQIGTVGSTGAFANNITQLRIELFDKDMKSKNPYTVLKQILEAPPT